MALINLHLCQIFYLLIAGLRSYQTDRITGQFLFQLIIQALRGGNGVGQQFLLGL